ncbi:adenosylmethionine--8-amino-7-oxononanoate aminotransferase BioA [Capnocytophaga stomatis]|uniref:adenosylmethionine--8-amino-7-oxononanoate transaminase n=1 Tax=Capnocytophaga stomatis TaxID=1848904 RepID=UPI0019512003|nr:adenosylmethionine--8-amino-7-oxononanoate transaminase [Capnocytophaga stomatis]GIJ97623.1 adenosylmethionine--8-amino-7-oxononanoate aminotransferase BioA [Capnocytophaga stomatis]
MKLQQRDEKHLWHPYTQHQTASKPLGIVKGKDALLWDEDGNEYIDAISSWWVNPFGHSNELLAQAAYKQLTQLEHVLFGGFTHEPAVLLAEKLISILPSNQQKLFFSDNGSTAVEVAIKMAIQYFFNKGEKKHVIVAFENAFHGDTFGAMAASGISFFTESFRGQLLEVVRIPIPEKGKEQLSEEKLKEAIAKHKVAAFIFEPLVQGAAGMKIYSEKALDNLIKIAKSQNVITIADEVMTGFGRTGKIFACDYLSEQPDIVCLSKALTGGTIPLAVTSATQEIFDAFCDEDVNKALFHGHTYMANPTGCAIALEAIRILQTDETQQKIKRIEQYHKEFVQKLNSNPNVENARTLGVILAFEIKTSENTSYYGSIRNRLYEFFIEKGIILRPVGNTVYILPPYIVTNAQLQRIYSVIEEAIEEFSSQN